MSGLVSAYPAPGDMGADRGIARELRRQLDPLRAQHLWDAIRAVRIQKQIPAIQRMSRYMNRFYGLTKDATQRLLDLAVEDNLIKLENKIGTKGTKSGVEEKAYRWPTLDMLPRERHDWYCFHCHSGGEVVLCGDCHRVYHEACLKEPLRPGVHTDDFLCHYCRAFQSLHSGGFENSSDKRQRRDLNHLLGLTCKKMKAKMPMDLLHRERPELVAAQTASKSESCESSGTPIKTESPSTAPSTPVTGDRTSNPDGSRKVDENDDSWRVNFLLKETMDFEVIAKKCESNHYRIEEEFRADCQLIVHNVVIYHGAHSAMADTARQMFRDCTFDLKDISVCRDCYRYANENQEKYWFCKPCRPFHELVYAKQKGGFPFWPAKIMRVLDGGQMYDVRFFGGYHQRALVEKVNIRPITVNIHSLQVKRTTLWNKSCEELRRHQELVEKVKQNPDFLKEPYGDPFASCVELKNSLGGNTSGEESEEEVETPEANEEIAKYIHSDLPTPSDPTPPPAKKKRGRPKKVKEEVNQSINSQSDSENQVTSSSPNFHELAPKCVSVSVQTPGKFLKSLIKSQEGKCPVQSPTAQEAARAAKKAAEKEFKVYAEKMRADFDQEKKRAVNVATRSLERDLERLKADHQSEMEELRELVEKQKEAISANKKKQWCYNCEAEAIYWCCWNTAYCTIECQQQHWHTEHKRSCRRKR